MKLTPNEHRALLFLAEQREPVSAYELGEWICNGSFDNRRSISGCGSNIGQALANRGLVMRELKRRELYVYSISAGGRAALVEGSEAA